jgi:hypothetical protein
MRNDSTLGAKEIFVAPRHIAGSWAGNYLSRFDDLGRNIQGQALS